MSPADFWPRCSSSVRWQWRWRPTPRPVRRRRSSAWGTSCAPVSPGGGALGTAASSTPGPEAAPAPAPEPVATDGGATDQASADQSAPMDESVGFYDDEVDPNRGPNPALADDPVPTDDAPA